MFIRNGVWAIISRVKDQILNSFLFKSLRFRIFLLMVLVGSVPTMILGEVVLQHYQTSAVNQRTSDATSQSRILADYLSSCGYLLDTSQSAVDSEINQFSNLYDGRILVINEDYKVVKDTYGIYDSKIIISEEVIRCFEGESSSNYDKLNHYIELTMPVMDSVTGQVKGVMLTSASTDSIVAGVDILRRSTIIIELVLFILLFAGSLWTSKRLVKPFGGVTTAISNIEAGYEQGTISVRGYSEMDSIVTALNQMLARQKTLDDSRQEFVSNVSHELKTPLASMKVLAESLVTMGDAAPVEMYREFMEDITHEIDRENVIITDLLSLVKMDKKDGSLNIKTVNINELLELILKRLGPIAGQNNIELIFESLRNVDAEIDDVKLTLAFSNLVENAIKYNRKDGWVRVTLDADHQFFMLTVEDSGIGIPEDCIDSVFERFYRVDKSHSREIGGTGLGLAITRSAILMHRGSIKVESELGEGSTFTVRIPLTYIQ